MLSVHKRFGVIAGFLILLLLLAINTAAQRHQLAIQVEHQQWFSDSRRVVQELGQIELLLKDAETGSEVSLITETSTTLHRTIPPSLRSISIFKISLL